MASDNGLRGWIASAYYAAGAAAGIVQGLRAVASAQLGAAYYAAGAVSGLCTGLAASSTSGPRVSRAPLVEHASPSRKGSGQPAARPEQQVKRPRATHIPPRPCPAPGPSRDAAGSAGSGHRLLVALPSQADVPQLLITPEVASRLRRYSQSLSRRHSAASSADDAGAQEAEGAAAGALPHAPTHAQLGQAHAPAAKHTILLPHALDLLSATGLLRMPRRLGRS